MTDPDFPYGSPDRSQDDDAEERRLRELATYHEGYPVTSEDIDEFDELGADGSPISFIEDSEAPIVYPSVDTATITRASVHLSR